MKKFERMVRASVVGVSLALAGCDRPGSAPSDSDQYTWTVVKSPQTGALLRNSFQ